ncbi:Integrase [Vibrio crassostreae]|nr:Integrase [Vibrio crassostreae]CAK3853168.1 Integrase [Vibrio crassostreae]
MELIQRYSELAENPYVTFNSGGEGVSRVFDLNWDFSASFQNKANIGFEHIDEKYRQDIQSSLYLVMQWQKKNSPDGTHDSINTLIDYRVKLTVLATLWGSSNFHLLSKDRNWKICTLKLKGYASESACRSLASTINALNKAGLIKRYVDKRVWSAWVKKGAKKQGQAIAFPEAIHINILKQVVDFVETYHPYRHQISDLMAKVYAYQSEMMDAELKRLGVAQVGDLTEQQVRSFSARTSRRIHKWAECRAIPNFQLDRKGSWLGKVLKMCFICVGLFSAARHQELLSMNKDSYEVTSSGISKISGFTTKGEGGEKIYTTWNTAPIAKLALELAFDATQATREYSLEQIKKAYQSGQLTQDQYDYRAQELSCAFIAVYIPYCKEQLQMRKSFKYDMNGDGVFTLNLSEFGIKATAEDVDEFDLLNPDRAGSLKRGGGLPRLAPHDLRRSFVVFMVKNRLGNSLTTKYQLKHSNVNMSKWYSNYSELARTNQLLMDTQLMDEFNEAIENSTVDAWDDIYNISKNLSGAEGERIAANHAHRLAQGEDVIMSRSELLALVRSGDKSIVLLPTGGYCTNRNCERLCSLMDIVEAPCEHKVITDKAARKLSRERDNLIVSFRAINDMDDYANELILDARKKKIQSIEPILVKHSIQFDSFKDDIKAVWS